MILWYAGLSTFLVYEIFSSSGIDYRLIAAGSLVPVASGAAFGEALYGHGLVAPTATTLVIGLVTVGKSRLARRQLLCIPVGWYFGIFLSGSWVRSDVFFWPFLGDASHLAVFPRLWVGLIRELCGVVAIWALVGLSGIYERTRFSEFKSKGRLPLPRELVTPR